MTCVNEMRVDFLACGENEGFARLCAAAFIMRLNPTVDQMNDIKTAVSEAVTNAIVHGYPEGFGRVVMKLRVKEGNILEIVVRDWGVGIADVEQARRPMFTTGNDERSGMGFTIMETFTDKMRVRSTPGKGTLVAMVKVLKERQA